MKGTPASTMATQVRQEEERNTKDVRKGQAIAGRMTETQVADMLAQIRYHDSLNKILVMKTNNFLY